MKPIRTTRTNNVYRGPTPDIADLPCRIEAGVCYSSWEPTFEERIAIAEGANIELAIFASPIPPVSLALDSWPREIE